MVTGSMTEQSKVVTPTHRSAKPRKDIALESENGYRQPFKKQTSIFSVGEEENLLYDEQCDEVMELPISPGKEIKVKLPKSAEGFGLVIVGGRDKPYLGKDVGIFIKEIKDGSVAKRVGTLEVEDKILEINGFSVLNVEHHEAVHYFKRTESEVELVVKKNAGVIVRAAYETEADDCWKEEEDKVLRTPEPTSDVAIRNFSAGGFAMGILFGCLVAVMAKRVFSSTK